MSQPATNSKADLTLPGVQTVEQRQKSQKAAAKSSKKELPVIYVKAPKPGEAAKKIQVPPGGARVVFEGQEGQKVKMTKTGPPSSQNGTVKVVRTTTSSLATTQPQVQVIKTGGASGQDQIILVQQQPQVVAYPYYGYRRYPYYGYPYYGWGWGYPYYW